MIDILVAVDSQMANTTETSGIDIAVTIVTLLRSWAFGNTVHAFPYS